VQKGTSLKGKIRVNPRNYQHAYINNPSGGQDILIESAQNRNRAFSDDIVVVRLLPEDQWKQIKDIVDKPSTETVLTEKPQDDSVTVDVTVSSGQGDTKGGSFERDVKITQKTGKVIHILQESHPRIAPGCLTAYDKSMGKVLFSPADPSIPRVIVPLDQCPQDYSTNIKKYQRTIFIVKITKWEPNCPFATGHIVRSLGEGGELEPETAAILAANDIEDSVIPDEVVTELGIELPWTIPEEERHARRDFTKECVVSIDPDTARDLDDALHCKEISGRDHMFEVGVHIADVSFFLKQNSKLDRLASQRATSVYLVHKVIPMLPRILCEELCSLNPNKDRLSMSIVWTMDVDGQITEEWIGRGVIKSAAKLSYNQAQIMLDEPDKVWLEEETPVISGKWSLSDIQKSVRMLNTIAQNLRKRRFDNGCLRLDQPKLQFTLNSQTGLPDGCDVYERKDTHKLVEEFMLLANMAVARKIASCFETNALLRRHAPPKEHLTHKLSEVMESLGMPIDTSSAGAIHKYIVQAQGGGMRGYDLTQMILTVYCTKIMETAEYFSTGMLEDTEEWRHYALNIQFYTHFTSPIRRYADVIVHRLLAECLDVGPKCGYTDQEVDEIAQHCNKRKMAAKRADSASRDLFFAFFVKAIGEIKVDGMVIQILDKSFDVVVKHLGIIKRVYCDQLVKTGLHSFSHKISKKRQYLTLKWRIQQGQINQELAVFSEVSLVLKTDKLLRVQASVSPPQPKKKSN
jgi:DIS3-like exonuclease 2